MCVQAHGWVCNVYTYVPAVDVCVCTHKGCVHECLCAHTYVPADAYICVCLCTPIGVRMYAYVYTCANIEVRVCM